MSRGKAICGAAVVAASSLYALIGAIVNSHPLIELALDFRKQLTAPIAALYAGYDVWHPAAGYLQRFHVDEPASMHPPSLLLLGAPLQLLPLQTAYMLWLLVSVACVWVAVLLLGRDAPFRLVLGAGAVIVSGGAAWFMLGLGQMTALVVLGFALARRYPHDWRGAAGVCLLAVAPQTALPVSAVLLATGRRKIVVRGWLMTLVLSLPFGALEIANAGNRFPSSVLYSLRRSANVPVGIDLLRSDARLPGLEALLLVVAMVAVVVAARRGLGLDRALAATVCLATVLAYHQVYDLLLVSVALAAVVFAESSRWWLSLPVMTSVLLTPQLVRSFGLHAHEAWAVDAVILFAATAANGVMLLRAEDRRDHRTPSRGHDAVAVGGRSARAGQTEVRAAVAVPGGGL